jgi:hypothetical protein
MASLTEKFEEDARAKKGQKSIGQLAKEAAEGRAGRREMYGKGAEELYAAGMTKAKDIEGQVDVLRGAAAEGTAKALAAQGPSADLRSAAGVATEAEKQGQLAVLQGMEKVGTAKQEAAAGLMDVAVGMEEIGTDVEDFSARRQELTAAMNTIIDKHKGFWNDDEEAMYREIIDMVNDPTIPQELKDEFTKKAEDIRSKEWDV